MREGSLQRSTTIQPDRPSRLKLAGFVWVAGLAFLAYLGVAIASGTQEGGPRLFGGFELPEDHAAIPLSRLPVRGQASWYGSQFHGLETASGVPSRYTVQVGAFGDPERAVALQREIARYYPEAVVDSDGTWHRVQIGAFDDRDHAESLRRELTVIGMQAVVVSAR